MQPLAGFDEIYVCCPGGLVSGGPEALHQLVDALRRCGKAAFISYWPESGQFDIPPFYREYNVEQRPLRDADGCLVVFPEVLLHEANRLTRSRIAIWWLSVDFYFQSLYFHDHLRRRDLSVRSRLRSVQDSDGLRAHRRSFHLAQSFYAQRFLTERRLSGPILCGYINDEYVTTEGGIVNRHREEIIAYNPMRGMEVTEALMRLAPDAEWVAISDMGRAEVQSLLKQARLYVDFGSHPGRQRLPREAAISGACVVTGRQGSAAFVEDVPIPDEWRIDETRPDFHARFAEIASMILKDHQHQRSRLVEYRAVIRSEKAKFLDQVDRLFIGGAA